MQKKTSLPISIGQRLNYRAFDAEIDGKPCYKEKLFPTVVGHRR